MTQAEARRAVERLGTGSQHPVTQRVSVLVEIELAQRALLIQYETGAAMLRTFEGRPRRRHTATTPCSHCGASQMRSLSLFLNAKGESRVILPLLR